MRRIEQNNLRKLKINRFNFAIPLMAIAGVGAIGMLIINQDVDKNASALSETTNVNVNNTTYSIGVNTVGDSIDINAESTSSGVYTAKKDTVTVTTNIPDGYSLYISAGSGDPKLYLDGDSSASYIDTTSGTYSSPQVLRTNTYGYAVPSSINGAVDNNFDSAYATPNPTSASKWAALPTSTNQQLIQTTDTANTDGEKVDVYYGIYLNNAVAAGTYTGSVTYTAMAEASSPATQPTNNATMNPTSGTVGEATRLMIVTNLHTLANVGAVTVSMRGTSTGATSSAACGGATADTSTGVLIITCNTPTDLAVGTYTVTASVPTYGKTYTIVGGFEIVEKEVTQKFNKYMPMQDFTPEMCTNDLEYYDINDSDSTTYLVTDVRTVKMYRIRKFPDGKCWMVQDLYLPSGTTLTSDDSNISGTYTVTQTNWSGEEASFMSFSSAKAGTSYISNYDVCPKGWHMPTYTKTGSTGDFNHLMSWGWDKSTFISSYGSATGGRTYYAGSSYTGDGVGRWWASTGVSSFYGYSLVAWQTNGYNGLTVKDSDAYSIHVRCIVGQIE